MSKKSTNKNKLIVILFFLFLIGLVYLSLSLLKNKKTLSAKAEVLSANSKAKQNKFDEITVVSCKNLFNEFLNQTIEWPDFFKNSNKIILKGTFKVKDTNSNKANLIRIVYYNKFIDNNNKISTDEYVSSKDFNYNSDGKPFKISGLWYKDLDSFPQVVLNKCGILRIE